MIAMKRIGLVSVFTLIPLYALACASDGCALSTDWNSQGFASKPGVRVDLRYDYINQNQLRTGTGTVDSNSIALPTTREIEEGTKTKYTTFGLDYTPGVDWGINVSIPYIDRSHTTFAAGDTAVSASHTKSVGDVRVLARYQGFIHTRNLGIQFGLKLPTGGYRNNFIGGPQAGQPLDRGLQPGTGTTDFLFGGYYFAAINEDWDYFTQALIQIAFNSKDNYRPGSSINLNGGVRYTANETVVPQMQINMRSARRDAGDNADVSNSGGTLVYFSPGVTINVTRNIKTFGSFQLPIYQNVIGYQLTPRWTASVGVRYEF